MAGGGLGGTLDFAPVGAVSALSSMRPAMTLPWPAMLHLRFGAGGWMPICCSIRLALMSMRRWWRRDCGTGISRSLG